MLPEEWESWDSYKDKNLKSGVDSNPNSKIHIINFCV